MNYFFKSSQFALKEAEVKCERSESISPTPSCKSPLVVASEATKPFLKFSVNAILAQNKNEDAPEDEDDAVNITNTSDLKGKNTGIQFCIL